MNSNILKTVLLLLIFQQNPLFSFSQGQIQVIKRAIPTGVSEEKLKGQILDRFPKARVQYYTGAMAAPFNKQTQVTCQGVEVFGRGRRVELMFNDGILGHIWIFISKEEFDSVTTRLEARFGKVVARKHPFSVFESGDIAIRSDPYEILVAGPELLAEIVGLE